MRLTYRGHKAIQICSGKITVLAVANPALYSRIVKSFNENNDELILIDDDFRIVDVSKHIEWCGDIISNGRLKTGDAKLLKYLEKNITNDIRMKINDTAEELFNLIQNNLDAYNISLKANYDGNINRLLKYCRIGYKSNISPFEIVINELNLCLMYNTNACLGFNNLGHYLMTDHISKMAEFVAKNNMQVLLIEFSEKSNRRYYPNCEFYSIDRDYVEWY
ncbi:type II-A CRISPR-associated protein Csn2 [Ligilactobacillus saerimneri]|uniref:type II-A CRISPR-associated protein Csn2 n=1 Tax=Ligilactobacillus saerimneri TaxID=228229 RepID=UPI001C0F89BF|nr:type II-A CRISPR-associated protein Csn2 [Ligilactobacillus saerimneri]MBU5309291.1 type II-A CRISPR-associated protein Csn2 [Ligilactobacillus saerimneri]